MSSPEGEAVMKIRLDEARREELARTSEQRYRAYVETVRQDIERFFRMIGEPPPKRKPEDDVYERPVFF